MQARSTASERGGSGWCAPAQYRLGNQARRCLINNVPAVGCTCLAQTNYLLYPNSLDSLLSVDSEESSHALNPDPLLLSTNSGRSIFPATWYYLQSSNNNFSSRTRPIYTLYSTYPSRKSISFRDAVNHLPWCPRTAGMSSSAAFVTVHASDDLQTATSELWRRAQYHKRHDVD